MPISEVYLKEETMNNNKLQESKCKSMVSEFSNIDKSMEKNSIVFGLKVEDELDDWDAAERQVQNHAIEDYNLEDNNKLKNDDIKFVEDDYKSSILNLYSIIQDLDSASIHEVSTIEENKMHFIALYGKEVTITICSNQQASNNEFIFEHQIATNFDILNEIRYTHKLSETVKQNLSYKTKYNQEKETKIYNKQLDHKISISNSYQVHTKGAQKKYLKSALDDVFNAIANKQYNSKTDKDIGDQIKYVCSNCKSTRHNDRTCDLKKK
ncbi:8951_t:CDS:2 [Gigaspora margarita]|uniref:8951_t:CDS:1 n=1 Tax=Gigaspora margarita TaxID=4874 RepID=A0ABN7UZR0_GIGMA|nr:8951_t:CDS:2 [Gigaspora margarita]